MKPTIPISIFYSVVARENQVDRRSRKPLEQPLNPSVKLVLRLGHVISSVGDFWHRSIPILTQMPSFRLASHLFARSFNCSSIIQRSLPCFAPKIPSNPHETAWWLSHMIPSFSRSHFPSGQISVKECTFLLEKCYDATDIGDYVGSPKAWIS